MPDFFEGEPCNIEWYPPDTEEKKKNLYAWFGPRTPPTGGVRIPSIISSIEDAHGKKTWGDVGFC
jgi:hypothetical protein